MQKPSSSVSSGNISPAIVGPNKDMKEVYVLGGLVFGLAIVIGASWFYSQDLAVSSATSSNDQLTGNQVSTLLKNQSTTSPLSEPLTKNVVTGANATIGDIVHSDIYFEVGRKGLTDEAKSILAAQADILKKNADWGLLIQGYTDQQGSASYNKKLGMKRAETVKAELMNAGVAEQQLKVVSLGEEGVLCVDTSDVCRNMNRRVHLEMRKIGQEHMITPTVATQTPESLLPSTGNPGGTDPSLPLIDQASGS
jgi:peptidoglycan-associated lipoprotein